MPKQKTHKGLAKRVKVTGRGKIKRRKNNTGHLMSGRSAKRRRQLRQGAAMAPADEKKTLAALGL